MKRRVLHHLAVPLLALLTACSGLDGNGAGTTASSSSGSASARPRGQSSFETQLNNGAFAGGDDRSNDGETGAPAPAEGADNGGAPQERLVEESDIYKLEGNTLYVLNRYRGLQIIDLSNLDAPRIIGRAPIYGWPKDMYVRGDNAYVIVSDYYSFWRNDDVAAAEDAAWYANYGSQLRIIDISNKQSPTVIGSINLQGDCGDSRIVGDVMYLVSHRYPWWGGYATDDNENKTQIVSVDISDPDNIHVVDTKDFPRDGWEHHIHVNSNTIFLAASHWDGYREDGIWHDGYNTVVKYIDISDPAGQIVLRGEANVPGRVQDRWAIDAHQGVLRIASGQNWGNGDVYLNTLDVQNPDAITQLGSYTLHVDEQLKSARFDGDRGYLVSFRQVDPLFTFDLSNPAQPRLLGELEMPGWLDFMVPLGDRVVALGHDETVDANGNRSWGLQVSLIDVSQDTPVLLSRVAIDGAWGWVPSERDDFAKVFRVLPEIGLIVFPFQAWDPTDWRYVGGVQLIDYAPTALTRRGLIRDAGWVERGVVHGENTVLTISSQVFQVMDIQNRDAPALRGRLELARNVSAFAVANDTHSVQLSGDWYLGDTKLTVTPLSDVDAATPTSSVHVPAPYGRLFQDGALTYVTSMQQQQDANGQTHQRTVVQVVDTSNPQQPQVRGTLTLPEPVWTGYGYWYWGGGDEVVQLDGNILAFHHYAYRYSWYDCEGCENQQDTNKIYLVDLSNPDAPRLASTISLDDVTWAWGLRARGRTLYLSDYSAFERDGQWLARYNLRTIDVTDVNAPVLSSRINVPGYVVGISDNAQHAYTVEHTYDSQSGTSATWLHALQLFEGTAYLQSSLQLPGYSYNVIVDGSTAFLSTTTHEMVDTAEGQRWVSDSDLVSIDLSDASNVHIADTADIPTDWGYLQKVAGGRAFVSGGAGIFVFDVDDADELRFESFFRSYGWAQDVVVHGNKAYVPSGYYGVQVLDLAANNNPL